MNPNRQNNCYVNRSVGKPPTVQPVNQGCYKENALTGLPVAMAYVPWQNYGNIYPMPQALQNGTMFPELNLDFAGRRCN